MEHVHGLAAKAKGCIFEPKGVETWNKEALLLYRNNLCVVLLNRFPYANGHLLLAPLRHIGDLEKLNTEENGQLMHMLQTCTAILKKNLQPDGFNIGLNLGKTAGAGIDDHLHFHIVPRWDGDHNFMTVISDIRTIPEHINHTFDRLLPEFQALFHD